MAFTQSFTVEFDDALLDQAGWKNPRYEGSKLTAARINRFSSGDVSYGLNPVIENKIVALYIGSTLIGGDAEEESYVEITNHSYATIDKILLIDLADDSVQIIDRQNTNPQAFRRFVDRDLSEGSIINFKLLDPAIENGLKPKHAIKFNRGSLQKIYAYTANTAGFEDGVFGGFGQRPQPGEFLDNLSGTLETPLKGMFGYGMTAAISASLFTTNSINFVDALPSELNLYAGEVDTSTLGIELNLVTQSFDADAPVAGGDTYEEALTDLGDTGGDGGGDDDPNAPR